MLAEYQTEQKDLSSRLKQIAVSIEKECNKDDAAKKFQSVAEQYFDMKELTSEIVNSLIDHIEIGNVREEDGEKVWEINIIYRFIG